MSAEICRACETVAHCQRHGCIPLVKLDQDDQQRRIPTFEHWFRRERLAGRLKPTDETAARYAWNAAIHATTGEIAR